MRGVPLLLILGAPFFFFGGPGVHGSRSFVALWDLGHVLFFFLASLWLFQYLKFRFPSRSFFYEFIMVFFIVLILGVSIEGLQMCSDGRLADVNDILRNQLGCLLTCVFLYPQKGYGKNVFRILMFIVASTFLIPLIRAVTDEYIAWRQFPVLSDFETVFEIDRWKDEEKLVVSKGFARHGEYSLQVQLTTDKYSGVSLTYFKRNWQGFENLFFSVYNPDDKVLEFVCRIHDLAHNNNFNDRFNRRFLLEKGWNDLVVSLHDIEKSPENRLLDLGEIEAIGFFVVEQKRERLVYIDSVYLE